MSLSIGSRGSFTRRQPLFCRCLPLLIASMMLLYTNAANAHFPWLVPHMSEQNGSRVLVHFGELAEPEDPELLSHIAEATLWEVLPSGELQELELVLTEESLSAVTVDEDVADTFYLLQHDYGVTAHGGSEFLLRYFAKGAPYLGSDAWDEDPCHKLLDFDLSVSKEDEESEVRVVASWKGTAQPEVEITIIGPGFREQRFTTDAQGAVSFSPARSGIYSLRAKYVEETTGEFNGETYNRINNYTTLAVDLPEGSQSSVGNSADADTTPQDPSQQSTPVNRLYSDMPLGLTSFGGAVTDEAIYAYGGHTGSAHSYSTEEQSGQLWRHPHNDPSAGWEAVSGGPRLQGLALVPWEGKLYRIGGFTALNEEGEDHDLQSQANVTRFDPETNEWTEMPPLPEPRSSFDAAMLGSTLYVVGGWMLEGEEDSSWHNTAWRMDLSAAEPTWEALPNPPFLRRALSVAVHEGKVYIIGGISEDTGPSARVDIFDPVSGEWAEGPSLPGDDQLAGFGCSAFATSGHLYVSLANGDLLRSVTCEGKLHWEVVQQLERARFFHRMIPIAEGRFVLFGGANMSIGKFPEVDVIEVE